MKVDKIKLKIKLKIKGIIFPDIKTLLFLFSGIIKNPGPRNSTENR